MAALTQDRNTPRAEGDIRRGSVAADEVLYKGAMLMRDADGFLVAGQTELALTGVGRSETRVANTGGADGAVEADYRPGVFRFANSEGVDEIDASHIGQPAYAVDDQTVAATDGTGTRSIAGFVDHVDALGVWVRFDEAMVRTYLAGITEPQA